jgi:hypothetical protein
MYVYLFCQYGHIYVCIYILYTYTHSHVGNAFAITLLFDFWWCLAHRGSCTCRGPMADGALRLNILLLLFVAAFGGSLFFNGEISSWDVSSVTTMQQSKWEAPLLSGRAGRKMRDCLVVGGRVKAVVDAGGYMCW